jgi:hypothetical protein
MSKLPFNVISKRLHRGFYEVINKDKYIGDDASNVMYRSGWELKFMIYCDNNQYFKRWGCELEQLTIPYYDLKGKIHKYIPDFYVEIIDPYNPEKEQKVIFEIKPHKQIFPSFLDRETGELLPYKNTLKAFENRQYELNIFQTNLLKWDAAKKFCKNLHMEFILIDEIYMKEHNIL